MPTERALEAARGFTREHAMSEAGYDLGAIEALLAEALDAFASLPRGPEREQPPPAGYERVVAYVGRGEIVVEGPVDGDESHNCDAMGCGSVATHVVARVPAPLPAARGDAGEARLRYAGRGDIVEPLLGSVAEYGAIVNKGPLRVIDSVRDGDDHGPSLWVEALDGTCGRIEARAVRAAGASSPSTGGA